MIQIGLSKIFMKDEVKLYLDSKINLTFHNYTIKIQSKFRKNQIFRKHQILRKKVLVLTCFIRGFFLREKYLIFVYLDLRISLINSCFK